MATINAVSQRDVISPEVETIGHRAGDSLPGLIMEIVDRKGRPLDLTDKRVFLTTRRVRGEGSNEWSSPLEIAVSDPLNGRIYRDLEPEDTNVRTGEWELFAQVHDAVTGELEITAPTRPATYMTVRADPSTRWAAPWDYLTPASSFTPAPGEAHQADDQLSIIRFANFDNNGVDQREQLLSLSIGDRVTLQDQVWSITGVNPNNPDFIRIDVDPATQAAADGVFDFFFSSGDFVPKPESTRLLG